MFLGPREDLRRVGEGSANGSSTDNVGLQGCFFSPFFSPTNAAFWLVKNNETGQKRDGFSTSHDHVTYRMHQNQKWQK